LGESFETVGVQRTDERMGFEELDLDDLVVVGD
jgi:hypothetical protein